MIRLYIKKKITWKQRTDGLVSPVWRAGVSEGGEVSSVLKHELELGVQLPMAKGQRAPYVEGTRDTGTRNAKNMWNVFLSHLLFWVGQHHHQPDTDKLK